MREFASCLFNDSVCVLTRKVHAHVRVFWPLIVFYFMFWLGAACLLTATVYILYCHMRWLMATRQRMIVWHNMVLLKYKNSWYVLWESKRSDQKKKKEKKKSERRISTANWFHFLLLLFFCLNFFFDSYLAFLVLSIVRCTFSWPDATQIDFLIAWTSSENDSSSVLDGFFSTRFSTSSSASSSLGVLACVATTHTLCLTQST